MSDGTPIIIKKVKGHGGHAHHGGSWKVAYADFMTAMMAFFMVMWIMGLSDDTKAQVAGYFNDPLGFKKSEQRSHTIVSPKSAPGSNPRKKQSAGSTPTKPEVPSKDKQPDKDKLKDLKNKIQAVITGDPKLQGLLKSFEMTITQEGLRIELVESKDAAFFKSSSAELNSTALRLVAKIVPVIRHFDRTYIVEGHTDSAPYPDPSYTNWDLSTDRAMSLTRALFSAGLSPRTLTGVRGLADTELKVPSDPRSFQNRRVTILLPFKTDTLEEGKLPKDLLPKKEPANPAPVMLTPHVGP